MPKIIEVIPQQNYELIRDRIADILIDELASQIAKGSDVVPTALYTERHVPVDEMMMDCILVSLATGKYDNRDVLTSTGTYEYYIDCYVNSPTTDQDPGDKIAAKKVQRLAGVIRTILSSSMYKTLGFSPPFNCNLRVSELFFGTMQDKDMPNVQIARVTVEVIIPENAKHIAPSVIYEYNTQVSIANSPSGYIFTGPGTSLPPGPTCLPVILKINSAEFKTLASGVTFNLVVVDENGIPVGSADGDTWKVISGGGSSSFESMFEFLNIYE